MSGRFHYKTRLYAGSILKTNDKFINVNILLCDRFSAASG